MVVLLSEGLSGLDELDRDQLVALDLEALDDFTHQATLYAIRLHRNERALAVGSLEERVRIESVKLCFCL